MLIISTQGASASGISIPAAVTAAIVAAVAAILVAVLNYFMQRSQRKEQKEQFDAQHKEQKEQFDAQHKKQIEQFDRQHDQQQEQFDRQHDQQQEQFSQQFNQTYEQLNILRSGQITDRYSKAVDQLGKGSGEVCLGGIYALGSIMREQPDYEEPVIAVLSAFVRRTGKVSGDGKVPWAADEAERDEAKPSFAIQAALDVIGKRRSEDSRAYPNLRDSDLRGARLRGADLRGASLRRSCLWKAHLQNADLGGADLNQADLTEARLAGVKLEGADLKGARLTRGRLTSGQLAEAKNDDQVVLIEPDLTVKNSDHAHPWVSNDPN